MDLSNNLASVLARQVVEHAERVAEARQQARREDAARAAPVDLGEATKSEEPPADPIIEPAAIFDKIREKDVGRMLDIIA